MKLNNGFSLIEVVVAAAIFSIVIGSISSLFVSSLRGQRSVFENQNLVDNTRFVFEQMSRQIRMAQRDESGTCTGSAGTTYSSSGGSLSFIDYRNPGNCITYDTLGFKIRMRPDSGEAFLDLTSDDIKVVRLNFNVRGRDKSDLEQPRVTISIKAEGATRATSAMLLQTTISARNIDVP